VPSNVAWFERLWYFSLAIGVVISALSFSRASAQAGPAFGIAILTFVVAVSVLLVWLIARRRKNWARWVLLIGFLLGLLAFPWGLAELFRASILAGTLSIVQTLIQIIAIYLIFTDRAQGWFKRRRAHRQGAG
jgi:K+ transporter